MSNTAEFFRSIIDSVTEHIVILDQTGAICFTNKAWIDFGVSNGHPVSSDWQGINYLEVCDSSAAAGDQDGKRVAEGIRKVIETQAGVYYYEYPCHSPTEKRWFTMRVTPLQWVGDPCFAISHQDITERRLAEEKVRMLSLVDGLTGVANRRYFDEFLSREWRRGARMHTPLSLILLDVDHFKPFNDGYGHVAGDECLKRVAGILSSFGRRPGDLPARYGGEEFALILANTDGPTSIRIAQELLEAVQDLKIPHEYSTVGPTVTVSLGIGTMYPQQDVSEEKLIEAADQALYFAKQNGRNRVSGSPMR